MRPRLLIAALALSALVACVPHAQTVVLRLTASVVPEDVGKNRRVLVVATDERPSGVLGLQRGAADAPVSTDGNAAALLEAQLVDGLRRKGFDAVTRATDVAGSTRTLTVTLRRLEYASTGSALSGDVHLKAALAAVARTGGAPLERTYRAEEDRRVGPTPSPDANARFVNETLSDVLSSLLNDERLLAFLAR